MGQAFRRASGRIRPPPAPSSSKPLDPTRNAPAVPVDSKLHGGDNVASAPNGNPKKITDNVLEERDSEYDAMLSKMVGRIQSKPGGKLEMGEAFVVEKYNRPMPKLRNTTVDSGRYEERPVPAGTLNVSQLRHIILLYQGKADDHNGPMDINQIAEKFRVDVAQVQRAVQFLSLPPGDNNKQKKDPR